ncbi:Ndt80 [Kluyveromyces lactis]|nr:Ndt80 [Kluyveromyces lactis]
MMEDLDHLNDENINIDENEFLETLDNADGDVIKTFRNADGSLSSHFDKRKVRIAPRSTLQFKIGPGFTPVVPNHKILNDFGQIQEIKLEPRIDRGFDFIDDDWIGYKRNYFTVVTSFDTPGIDHIEFMKQAYHLDNGVEIKYFATKLAAKCLEDDKLINLVQHTAKRDKGPQFAPPIHVIAPANLPKHQIIRDASNVRNESKMKKFDSYFFLHKEDVGTGCEVRSVLANYPSDPIKKVARYERIQFASSITLKKTSQQNRRFSLLVVLGCYVKGRHDSIQQSSPYHELDHYDEETDMTFVPILMEKTPPLIIRGRSPSNYCQQIKVMHTKKSDLDNGSPQENDLEVPADKKERKRRGRKSKQPDLKTTANVSHDSAGRIPTLLTNGLPSTFEISPTSGNMRIKNIQLHSSSTETSFPRGFQSESLSVAYFSNSATPIQDSIFKKRRLNISKPVVLESNLEEPLDDITENIFNTISFEERTPSKENKERLSSTSVFLLKHVTYDVSEPPAVAIPRAMLPNKMEISYCLNDYSSSFIEYPPPSTSHKRLPGSRRLLTASGNPSDLLNPADWSDGPSIFRH